MRQYEPIACQTCKKEFTPRTGNVKDCPDCRGEKKKAGKPAQAAKRNVTLPSPHEMLAELIRRVDAREKQYASLVSLVEALYAKSQSTFAILSEDALERVKRKLAEAYLRLAGETIAAQRETRKLDQVTMPGPYIEYFNEEPAQEKREKRVSGKIIQQEYIDALRNYSEAMEKLIPWLKQMAEWLQTKGFTGASSDMFKGAENFQTIYRNLSWLVDELDGKHPDNSQPETSQDEKFEGS